MSDKYILRVIAEAACERLMQQIDRLKAEVEEVTNDNIRLSQENGGLRGERDCLKAEVERLTKAALQVHQELDEFGQVSAKSVHELRDAIKGVQS